MIEEYVVKVGKDNSVDNSRAVRLCYDTINNEFKRMMVAGSNGLYVRHHIYFLDRLPVSLSSAAIYDHINGIAYKPDEQTLYLSQQEKYNKNWSNVVASSDAQLTPGAIVHQKFVEAFVKRNGEIFVVWLKKMGDSFIRRPDNSIVIFRQKNTWNYREMISILADFKQEHEKVDNIEDWLNSRSLITANSANTQEIG